MTLIGSFAEVSGSTWNGGAKKKPAKKVVKKPAKPVKKPAKPVKKAAKPAKKPVRKARLYGGDEGTWSCSSCQFIPAVPNVDTSPPPPELIKDDLIIQTPTANEPNIIMEGGSLKVNYKKSLAKLTAAKLISMASSMSIKTTKKKDGRTVSLKKETIINKLCDKKHGK